MSTESGGASNPVTAFTALNCRLLRHPFTFGENLSERPSSEGWTFLLTSMVLFVVAAVLDATLSGVEAGAILARAQWVVLGLILAAFVVGNGLSLLLSRMSSGTAPSTGPVIAAAPYVVGFGLVWLAAFTLLGVLGQLLLPGYRGSFLEAIATLGYVGVGIGAVVLLLEWPRRAFAVAESTFYALVAILVVVVGGAIKASGLAG